MKRFLHAQKLVPLLLAMALLLPLHVWAQNHVVTGTVTSDTNETLPGVYVLVKGTSIGTSTDADGKYSLDVPDNATLVFTFIGMKNNEVAVGNQSVINVIMETDVQQLSEVVVVGYGTQKKSDLTGSVASVSMDQLEHVPITRADQMLQGRVSGVQITQTNAQPGGGVSIRIRGTNSINSGNEPLFVIDGFPGAGDLNSINPNDIESIDVLKDASATAIYGSRGANGVIIITTKRGKAGRNNVSFEVYRGVQTVRKQYDLMNAREFATYLNDVQTLANTESPSTAKPLPYTQSQIDSLGEGTDWQDAVFRTAPISNYQLSFNGGDEGTRYNLSFNYFSQDGIVINSGFKRGSIRFNYDRKISNKLNFNFTSQVTRTFEKRIAVNSQGGSFGGVVLDAVRMSPIVPVYDTLGDYTYSNSPVPYVENAGNPVAYANKAKDQYNTFRGLFNGAFEYEILKGLKLRVSGGADLRYNQRSYYLPSDIFLGSNTNGSATKSDANSYSWINENTLTYNKKIGEIHDINLVVGSSAQQFVNEDYSASSNNFFTNALGTDNLSIGSSVQTPSSGKSKNSLASFFGRLNYHLNNKYLVTFTMRADGSSRFGPNNKWGYFPSGAIAWRIIDENFMSGIPQISDLKLRASYGRTGNQEIGSYQSKKGYSANGYTSGTLRLVGISPYNIPNPNLRWEATTSFDIGLDAGFFNNRITLTADYYSKKTKDLLLNVSIPRTTGYGSILLNSGSVENKGFEIGINTVNIDRGKLRWNTNFNLSSNKNKVLDLNGEYERYVGSASSSIFPNNSNGGTSVLRVGEPIGSFYGYRFEGIWQTPEEIASSGITSPVYKPGDPRYADLEPDGVINAKDRTIIGHALPKFIYGITNTISYGRFNLMIMLQGVQGCDVLNINRYELETGYTGTNKLQTVNDRWHGPGTSNTIPKANSTVRRTTGITSDIVEDGSFLRVKTVTLGYDIAVPKGISKVVRSANIYVTGQNLYTFTNYSGYDPEVNSFGSSNLSLNTDYNSFPSAKTLIVGLKLNF